MNNRHFTIARPSAWALDAFYSTLKFIQQPYRHLATVKIPALICDLNVVQQEVPGTEHTDEHEARRPGLDQTMADARRGKFDLVLVWASDMIARSVKHFLDVLDELNRFGVDYVSFRENIDTAGPMGKIARERGISRATVHRVVHEPAPTPQTQVTQRPGDTVTKGLQKPPPQTTQDKRRGLINPAVPKPIAS